MSKNEKVEAIRSATYAAIQAVDKSVAKTGTGGGGEAVEFGIKTTALVHALAAVFYRSNGLVSSEDGAKAADVFGCQFEQVIALGEILRELFE